MNTLTKIGCLSLAALMAGCVPAGYYDSNGVYRSYGKSDSFRNEHAMAGTPETSTTTYSDEYAVAPSTTTIIYTKPGYYDRNGYYIAADSGPHVPEDLFPPRGMCRVWFTDRAVSYQPPVESCNGIQSRVPAGAYVIYGG